MQLPFFNPGFYRIIVFIQNVEIPDSAASSKVKFEPVIYAFSFRLFSFEKRSKVTVT